MSNRIALIFVSLMACGGGGDDDAVDATTAPAMITITGTASTLGVGGSTPTAGVLVEAFANSAETTVVAMATTDATGNYTLTVTTNGTALDGFLKATKSGLVDTYLYPPAPLAADFAGASLNMVSSGTFDLVSSACQGNQEDTKGLIAVLVHDAAGAAVAGATVESTPAASKYCYNSGGLPSGSAAATDADGIGFMFNVTGSVSVTATKAGTTFKPHSVKARAMSLTTTLIVP
jgi:hypothetical protein